jgi:transketolase
MSSNKQRKVAKLKAKASEVRKTLLTMIYYAQSGHPGGSLSATDIMTALYFDELKIDPQNPKAPDHDRFVLSKGHVCPVLYTVLMLNGFFGEENVKNLRKYGSILQGHPDMKRTPGVDMSTGSLGQGMACAVGMAIAAKRDKSDVRVFTLVGDGESNEGLIWEAAQAAAKYELDNLTVIVDHNGLQNDGTCEEIMPPQSLAEKFKAFGFYVVEIDGHNMEEIIDALDEIREVKDQPKCIVAKTVKGKGVSFMENVVMWHGVAPNDEQYAQAIKEIEEAQA